MTIICIRDGVMAADTGVWQGQSLRAGTTRKIIRTNKGLATSCGNFSDGAAFHKWVDSGCPEDGSFKPGEEFYGVIMSEEGVCTFYDSAVIPFPIDAAFYVLGAGQEIAIGAMAAGAAPGEAVKIVIEYSDYAFGDIQVMEALRPGNAP